MTKLRDSWGRIAAVVLLVAVLFAGANYYLDLGFFGAAAKGVLILAMGVVVVYGAFFAPKRKDKNTDGNAVRNEQNR